MPATPVEDRPRSGIGATEALFLVDPAGRPRGSMPTGRELLDAAGSYLRRFMNDGEMSPAPNLDSSRFGTSDLVYVDQAKRHVICARLDAGNETEGFLLSSISYYFWLREVAHAARSLFDDAPILDMFIFLNRLPTGVCYMLEKLRDNLRVHLVRYRVLPVGGGRGTALYFEHLFPAEAKSVSF